MPADRRSPFRAWLKGVRQKVNNALGRRTLVAIASADGHNLPVGFHGLCPPLISDVPTVDKSPLSE